MEVLACYGEVFRSRRFAPPESPKSRSALPPTLESDDRTAPWLGSFDSVSRKHRIPVAYLDAYGLRVSQERYPHQHVLVLMSIALPEAELHHRTNSEEHPKPCH